MAANSSVIGDLRSHGMLFGLELVRDQETKEVWPAPQLAEIAKKVAAVGKNLGVMLAAYEYEGKMVLVLAPPLNVTDGELEHDHSARSRGQSNWRGVRLGSRRQERSRR